MAQTHLYFKRYRHIVYFLEFYSVVIFVAWPFEGCHTA